MAKTPKTQQVPSMRAAFISLTAYCPEISQWPTHWQRDTPDIAVGERIVAQFTPFLAHLLASGLARSTLVRHRGNVWLLGGELIRRRYDDDAFARLPAELAIGALLHEDGGPLIWPYISEAEQDAFDGTCRKFYWYLQAVSPGGISRRRL